MCTISEKQNEFLKEYNIQPSGLLQDAIDELRETIEGDKENENN